MSSASNFLTQDEKSRITAAISEAEKLTNGEIRVHVENWCWSDAFKHAQQLFFRLGMDKTEQRTGVLIYVAVKSHKLAIIGDTGINSKVPQDFWQSALHHSITCFKEHRFGDGIVDAVNQVGVMLERHFPKTDSNPDELTNEISFG